MKIFFPLLLITFFSAGDSALYKYFKEPKSRTQIKLPPELNEISGIAFDSSGNLYGHNDEEGIIYQIDLKTASILEKIYISEKIINADFEDIAIANSKFFLLTSSGKIYSFNRNRKDNSYEILSTGLNEKHNCEGMMFNKKTNSVLIACKDYSEENSKKFRAVYSFSLERMSLDKRPFLLISLDELKKEFGIYSFHPSAIAYNENSDSYFILSAKGKPAIIEIRQNGKIIDALLFAAENHPKPEGIQIFKGKLYISDEGVNSSAQISVYSK